MTTKSNIAQALGVAGPQVTRWARRGMPVYDVEAAKARVSSNIRKRQRWDPAATLVAAVVDPVGDPPARTWRERLDRANAETREHELGIACGDYLLRAAVLAAWQKQILAFRARLLAIPNNVGAASRRGATWPGSRRRIPTLGDVLAVPRGHAELRRDRFAGLRARPICPRMSPIDCGFNWSAQHMPGFRGATASACQIGTNRK